MTREFFTRDAMLLAVNAGARSADFVCSTSAIDRHDTVLDPGSWNLEAFRANPVVLFAHKSCELPVGRAENTRVEDGKLVTTVFFASAQANPFAEQVWQSVQEKTLRAVSVGFLIGDYDFLEVDGRSVMVLKDLELVEISITPVGSNPEALASARQRAIELTQQRTAASASTEQNEEQPMKTILRALGLLESATEADATAAAMKLTSDLQAVLALTGKANAGEALAVMRSWQGSAKKADEAIAKLAEADEKRALDEHAALMKQGTDSAQIVPALVPWAKAQTVQGLRDYLAAAPRAIPAATESKAVDADKTKGDGDHSYKGGRWEDLTPGEKHRLFNDEPATFKALKADWKKRTGKLAAPADGDAPTGARGPNPNADSRAPRARKDLPWHS